MKTIKHLLLGFIAITFVCALSACETTIKAYEQVDKVLDARCAAIPENIRNLERIAFEAKTGISWDLCFGRKTNG